MCVQQNQKSSPWKCFLSLVEEGTSFDGGELREEEASIQIADVQRRASCSSTSLIDPLSYFLPFFLLRPSFFLPVG